MISDSPTDKRRLQMPDPYFEDLQPCTAFPGTWRNLLAVGWLSKDHAFTRGPVEEGLLARAGYWSPPAAPHGSQICALCGVDTAPVARRALFVPGDDVLYVAPGLLKHYVRKHEYLPPPEFLKALRRRGNHAAVTAFVTSHLVEPAAQVDRRSPPLLGVEPIRHRPGMYIGSTGASGLQQVLLELVGNSVDEFLVGAATRISVDIDERHWASVEDDGRGIPVALLESAFTQLHAGATLDGHIPHVHVRSQAFGVGVASVSAVSARVEVETRRDGVLHSAVFARGRIVEPLRQNGPTNARGTRVRFFFDDELFDDGARFDLESVDRALEELAWLAPKLDVRLQGKSLQKPEGLSGWLREFAPDVVPETVLSTTQTVDDVDVEVVFGWRPRTRAPLVRAFANYAETVEEKSSNRVGLISALRTYVRAKRGSMEKNALNGLVAIVHVGLQHPRFGGPTRSRLENEEVEKAVNRAVMNVINSSPSWWHSLHEAMR